MDIFHTDMNFEYINIWLCSKEGHKWAPQYWFAHQNFRELKAFYHVPENKWAHL